MLTPNAGRAVAVMVCGAAVLALSAGVAQGQCYTTVGYSSYYTPYYAPPVFVTPAPVYASPVVVAPPPAVVVAPPPAVFVAPRPVVCAPAPVYYSRPVYRTYGFVGGSWGHCRPRGHSFGFGFGWRH